MLRNHHSGAICKVTVIWRFQLGALELIYISVCKKKTLIIKPKSGATAQFRRPGDKAIWIYKLLVYCYLSKNIQCPTRKAKVSFTL
jgi:hypothetical protein